jgi:c-di-GMP-binding flagellar brake protein YcgR
MITIGDILILEPKFSPQREKYKCMIVEMNEDSLYIDYPVNTQTGKVVFLTDGSQMKMTFTSPDGTAYLFDSEVLGRVKGNIPAIQMSRPDESTFIKIQRRQFVRVETPIDAAIHPLNQEFQPFRAITEDISAGGAALRFAGWRHIEPSSMIALWLVLPLKSGEIQYLHMNSRVIRMSESDSGFQLLSVQFADPSEADTQTLLRFIFEKQLEFKKKGIMG